MYTRDYIVENLYDTDSKAKGATFVGKSGNFNSFFKRMNDNHPLPLSKGKFEKSPLGGQKSHQVFYLLQPHLVYNDKYALNF